MGRADPIDFAFTTFDVPGAINTEPHGINDVGQIVGSYTTSANSPPHGFLYDGSAFTTIDVPPQPGLPALGTTLFGINNAGQIAGTIFENILLQNPHAFELDSRGVTFLDFPGHRNGVAYGINNSGQIVGYFYDDVATHGFLYTNGAITAIDIPGLTRAGASAINNLGQIVMGGDTYDGFLYSNGTFTTIHFPGARNTYLYGINDAGQIVGMPAGVLDPDNGFIPIGIPGARGTIPFGINNVGQIVGRFVDDSGVEHGFIATPVPEAASVLFIAAGLLVTMLIGRRRVVAPDRMLYCLRRAASVPALSPTAKAGA